MAGYEAIEQVSLTLRGVLQEHMEMERPDATPLPVTFTPPDQRPTDLSGTWLNLYLYQVAEHAYLQNQELPGAGHPAAFGHPPLSLTLQYLLTAYVRPESESDADLSAQRALGDAMRVFHDHAIIPRDHPDLQVPLRDEYELIKITLVPTDLDEVSKVWSAMPEANFRRSVSYQVSVVQIESRVPRRYPRLVGEPPEAGPRAYAVPIHTPRIREIRVIHFDDLDAQEHLFPYARLGREAGSAVGDTLVLIGSGFRSEHVRVVLGTVEVTPTLVRDDRIELQIVDNVVLQPGTQTVRVTVDLDLSQRLDWPPGRTQPLASFESNIAIFVLVPWVEGVAESGGRITITGKRLWAERMDCCVLIGDRVVRWDPDHSGTSTFGENEIVVDRPMGLPTGTYPMRVRVNGVENTPDTSIFLP